MGPVPTHPSRVRKRPSRPPCHRRHRTGAGLPSTSKRGGWAAALALLLLAWSGLWGGGVRERVVVPRDGGRLAGRNSIGGPGSGRWLSFHVISSQGPDGLRNKKDRPQQKGKTTWRPFDCRAAWWPRCWAWQRRARIFRVPGGRGELTHSGRAQGQARPVSPHITNPLPPPFLLAAGFPPI